VRRIAAILVAVSVLGLGGCAASVMRSAVPAKLATAALVPDLPSVRYWGDENPKAIGALIDQRVRQVRAAGRHHERPIAFLALSGGGSDGAFGAGLLAGWSQSGRRPEFEVVTGISTGALIAPFAFLGPRYDDVLRRIYTSYSTDQLVTPQIVSGLLGGVAITETDKLSKLIEEIIDERLLRELAREHNRGRRLLIGTTNLDAQRPVVWDMGAIAARDTPEADHLFRQVLLASAAIPGVFPPVFIDVEADGVIRQEMHVDGGTTSQVFFLPAPVLNAGLARGVGSSRRLFVISNGKLAPEYEEVPATTYGIAARSLWTLVKSQWLGNLRTLYDTARHAGIDFNLTAIPDSFDGERKEPFDAEYMRQLFALGEEIGSRGGGWTKSLPTPSRAGQ
jgi:hypothetical protein